MPTKSEKRAILTSAGALFFATVFHFATTNQDDMDTPPVGENLCGDSKYLAEYETRIGNTVHNLGDICQEEDGWVVHKFGKATKRPATPEDKTNLEKLESLDKMFDELICGVFPKIMEIIDNPNLTHDQRRAQLKEYDPEMSDEEVNKLSNAPEAELMKVRAGIAKYADDCAAKGFPPPHL